MPSERSMSISSIKSSRKPIKILRLYDVHGSPFEACIGTRIDSLLEVDYRYSILNAKTTPGDTNRRVIQSLSYYNPVSTSRSGSSLPTNHFHVKVDNPPHVRYQTPRPDPPSITEANVPIWAPPDWTVSAKGNPLRPEHVESIQGISNLVCLVCEKR
jgi:hypothetical protein